MASKRRALVTAAPELPLELVDPSSPLMARVEEINELSCKGLVKSDSPLLRVIQSEVKAGCQMYMPMAGEAMCASGRDGNAVFRGSLCTRVCAVGDTEADKNILKGEVGIARAMINVHGIDAVIAALQDKAAQQDSTR
jgi:hypothetical protein